MLKIGLTGGIGSGKSTVCRLFAALGIPVYDTDSAARRLMESDPALIAAIGEAFGASAYKSGALDRKYLAARVFSDPASLSRLNSIVHPAVGRDFLKWAAVCETGGHPYVIHESAILFESGFDRYMDKTVTVSAPVEVRVARVAGRDSAAEQDIRARMEAQMNDSERESRADYVINNDGSELLMPQVEHLDKIFRNESRG